MWGYRWTERKQRPGERKQRRGREQAEFTEAISHRAHRERRLALSAIRTLGNLINSCGWRPSLAPLFGQNKPRAIGMSLASRCSVATTFTLEAINQITSTIIAGGIKVHRTLGPGLLESAYLSCLCHELAAEGLRFET